MGRRRSDTPPSWRRAPGTRRLTASHLGTSCTRGESFVLSAPASLPWAEHVLPSPTFHPPNPHVHYPLRSTAARAGTPKRRACIAPRSRFTSPDICNNHGVTRLGVGERPFVASVRHSRARGLDSGSPPRHSPEQPAPAKAWGGNPWGLGIDVRPSLRLHGPTPTAPRAHGFRLSAALRPE